MWFVILVESKPPRFQAVPEGGIQVEQVLICRGPLYGEGGMSSHNT